jgi:hypothetical protein
MTNSNSSENRCGLPPWSMHFTQPGEHAMSKSLRSSTPMLLEKLPFIGPRKKPFPRDFWHNVSSTGDMLKDQRLGNHLGWLALQAIKADNFSPLLASIALGMIEHQCPKHIVIGFFQAVADACLGIYDIPSGDQELEPVEIRRTN